MRLLWVKEANAAPSMRSAAAVQESNPQAVVHRNS
jgi:hypothetical protein